MPNWSLSSASGKASLPLEHLTPAGKFSAGGEAQKSERGIFAKEKSQVTPKDLENRPSEPEARAIQWQFASTVCHPCDGFPGPFRSVSIDQTDPNCVLGCYCGEPG